ncbi:hypothetical protein JQK88_34710 [Mesorhizobium caraganae]|nr:hypothetical protein [Mesorhizobium caraganae]
MLSAEEEAAVVAFRTRTLLPFYGCLYALQATIPQLTGSSLHRCFSATRRQPSAGITRVSPEENEARAPLSKCHEIACDTPPASSDMRPC